MKEKNCKPYHQRPFLKSHTHTPTLFASSIIFNHFGFSGTFFRMWRRWSKGQNCADFRMSIDVKTDVWLYMCWLWIKLFRVIAKYSSNQVECFLVVWSPHSLSLHKFSSSQTCRQIISSGKDYKNDSGCELKETTKSAVTSVFLERIKFPLSLMCTEVTKRIDSVQREYTIQCICHQWQKWYTCNKLWIFTFIRYTLKNCCCLIFE